MSITNAKALFLLTAFVAAAALLVKAAAPQNANATLPTKNVNRKRHLPTVTGNDNKPRRPHNPVANSNANRSTLSHPQPPVANNANTAGNRRQSASPGINADNHNSTNASANPGAPSVPVLGGASPPPSVATKPRPDADILLPENFPDVEKAQVNSGTGKLINTTGAFSEIADKRKVFVNLVGNLAEDVVAGRLKSYGRLEIVKTPAEAEFVIHYYYGATNVPPEFQVPGTSDAKGGLMVVTIRDASKGVPRIIWRKSDDGTADARGLRLSNPFPSFLVMSESPGRLTDHFIEELKKLRGEGGLLLPEDFKYFQRPNPQAPWNTEGKFSEIAGLRKVFINTPGEAGATITARLREYGRLEIVGTDAEAEFAIHYYPWVGGQYEVLGQTNTVTGGALVVTIRDPSQHIPRIIWRHDDQNGGWLKKGEASDKLIKRFISDLKKLRGEK